MSRYTRLLNADHDTTDEASSSAASASEQPPSASTNSKMSSMLASLKESATNAGEGMKSGMSKASGSVRTGLGIPTASGEEDNSDTESQASSMLDEVSEYCPKMTFQQVRLLWDWFFSFSWRIACVSCSAFDEKYVHVNFGLNDYWLVVGRAILIASWERPTTKPRMPVTKKL